MTRFPVEPWQVREPKLDLDVLAQSESLFALSNGHIGLRGNLDEGEPHGLPGTYLNSFYEVRPLPYAEAGYGYPEAGQTLVDVTNGKIMRLLVDDEPFDVRYGEAAQHERVLDLRAGTLTRNAHWRSPAGKQVSVTSTRLVSLAHRSVAAIEYIVEAVDEFVRVTVQSELVANEDQPHDVGRSARLGHPRQPAGGRRARRHRKRRAADAPDPRQRADDGGGDGPRNRRRGPLEVSTDARRGSGPHDRGLRTAAGTEAAHRQVPGLRLVEPAVPAGAARPGRRRACTARATAAGRACSMRSADPRRLLGLRRRRGRGRSRSASRRCGSGCSTCCRPVPAPNGRGMPARG